MTRRSHIFAIVALVAAILIAFSDVLSSDIGLFYRDHVDVFRPRFFFITEALRTGRMPVFPLGGSSGVPLEYLLNGTYLPFTSVLLLGPFDVTYDWYVIVHFVALAAGVYGLATSVGARPTEALLAAAVTTLCGPVLSNENLLDNLHGLAMAPWVFWALHRLLVLPSMPRTGAFALALGWQMQGTIPAFVILDFIAGVALLLVVRPRAPVKWGGAIVAATVLALGFAAIEVMPVLENLPNTRRGVGFDYAEASRWALLPSQFIEFIAPSFWAPPELPYVNAPSMTGSEHPPYFSTLYAGSAIAVAASALGRPRAAILAWVGLAVFAMLLAMGPATPFHRWMTALPLLSSSRFPVKLTVTVVGCIAVLSALALRQFEQRPRVLVYCALAQAGLAFAAWSVVAADDFAPWLASQLTGQPLSAVPIGATREQVTSLAVVAMKGRLMHAVIFAVSLAGAAALGASRLVPVVVIRWLVAIIVLLDLSVGATSSIVGAPVHPEAPPEEIMGAVIADGGKLYSATPRGRKAPFAPREGETHFASAMRSSNLRGHNAHRSVRYFRDIDRDAQSHRASVLAFDLLQGATTQQGLTILGRAGVAWVSTYQPSRTPRTRRLELDPEKPQFFYPVPGARPYALAFSKWHVVPVEDMSTERLRDDLARADDALVFSPIAPPAAACTATSTTTVLTRDAGRVTLTQSGACETVVTIVETAAPDWRAFVDDEAAELLITEFGFLGTRVPAGTHDVRFEYAPRTTRWIPVSAASALVIALLLLAGLRRRRSGPIMLPNSL